MDGKLTLLCMVQVTFSDQEAVTVDIREQCFQFFKDFTTNTSATATSPFNKFYWTYWIIDANLNVMEDADFLFFVSVLMPFKLNQ